MRNIEPKPCRFLNIQLMGSIRLRVIKLSEWKRAMQLVWLMFIQSVLFCWFCNVWCMPINCYLVGPLFPSCFRQRSMQYMHVHLAIILVCEYWGMCMITPLSLDRDTFPFQNRWATIVVALYVSIALQITLETSWCIAFQRRHAWSKMPIAPKACQSLEGLMQLNVQNYTTCQKQPPRVQILQRICHFSTGCSLVHFSFSIQTQLRLVLYWAFCYTLIHLIDRETVKSHFGWMSDNIKEGGSDLGLSCHESTAQCVAKNVRCKVVFIYTFSVSIYLYYLKPYPSIKVQNSFYSHFIILLPLQRKLYTSFSPSAKQRTESNLDHSV